MLDSSRERILAGLGESDLVIDVGGWGKPFERADWVLDVLPYESRPGPGEAERFSAETWLQRDICDRELWPFSDDQFEFAVCSQTLEDVRDPVWVCSELNRVAKAGYIEVPSRLAEQAWGVAGQWVGWSHHHWLVDVGDDEITFVFKPHVIHSRPGYYLEEPLVMTLTDSERVQTLFWEGSFSHRERIFFDHQEFEDYLAGFVARHRDELRARLPRRRRRLRRSPD